MSYGDLIRDAFRISWRNKYLWFFGFFAGGSGANLLGNVPSSGGNLDGGDFEQSGASGLAAQVGPGIFGNAALIVALVVVGVVLLLAFVVMSLISQGALSENVAAIDRGEGRRFSSGWRAGLRNLWRVLGYYVVFFLIAIGLLIAIGVPIALLIAGTFAATDSVGARIGVAVLVGLLGVLLLILVFVPLSIIGQYSLREIVVRREGVFASVGGGYRVFRTNVGRSLLLWLINLGLGIGVGIAVLIGLLLVGLVLFLPTILLVFAEGTTAAVVTGIIAGVILLPIVLVVSGATGAFFHSYWTLAYLRLTGYRVEPGPAQQSAVA
jgi:membrane-anchored glycerophosphoryl diester phosphodiesterase (GDPDase)